MTALITGATGFIGSHLAEMLHAKGISVRALVRPTSDRKWIEHLPIDYVVASMDDPVALEEAVKDVDYIYHLAGVVAAKNRAGFFRGNVDATKNLLIATAKVNPGLKRFLHGSSLAAVGPSRSEESPVTEEEARRPITTYGESKAAAEEIVEEYSTRIATTIIRPPAVYGPRDIGILTFFQVAARGIAPLIGFDRKVLSLVHVRDLVRGIVQAAESERSVGNAYFIGSNALYTWEEIGETAARELGKKKPRYIRVPHSLVFAVAGMNGWLGKFMKKPPILDREKGRDITQRYWTCSVERAHRDFGYRQEVSIEEGVAETIEWYRRIGWIR